MQNQQNSILWPVLNTLGLAGTLLVNALATILPLNGVGTGELSDAYPNLFVPAGLTFSVWGIIYLLLIAMVVYLWVRRDGSVGLWFLISNLANTAWIFAWHWRLVGLSLVFMLVLLGALIKLYLHVRRPDAPSEYGYRWFVRLPFSVYLGWITVATIANITALAVTLGAPSFGTGPAVWTAVVLVAAVVITGLVLLILRDIAYALVPAWAFLGIYLKRSTSMEDGSALVATLALGGLILILVGIVITAIRQLRPQT